MLYAFKDSADGVYQVDAPVGGLFPAWAMGMTLLSETQRAALFDTLAQAQVRQLGLLYASYQAAVQQDISFTTTALVTKTFQADFGSQETLAKMIAAFQKTGIAPAGFYWVSRDNTQVPFTFADMQGLAAAMGAQGWAAFQNLQARKASVMAATTVAQVQAVAW